MADNPSTVVVTVTDYTTVYPTALPSITDLESFPIVAPIQTSVKLSSTFSASQPSTLLPSVRSSQSSTFVTVPSSSGSLQDSTSLSTPTSRASNVTSTVSAASSKSTASTESSTSTAPPGNLVEKHPDNSVPILMLVVLILVAFFLCGALLYFVYCFFFGERKDCRDKTAEIIRLKKRLGPHMARERATSPPMSGSNPANSNFDEVSLEPGEEITLPREVYERGVRIVKAEKKATSSPSSDARSDPFSYDGASIPQVSTASADSLHWRRLTEEQNRAQALHELTRPHPETLDESFEEIKLPFWKRTLARTGITNYGRPPGVPRPVHQDLAGRDKAPGTSLRTASNPGPAPPPPTVPTAVHRADGINPYHYNAGPRISDAMRSHTGSSDAVPGKYAQPMAESGAEFITIALAPSTPRTAALEAAEHARLTELRRQKLKRRTNGYGGLGS